MTDKTSAFRSVWHNNEPYFFIDQEPLPTKMEAEFVIVGGGFTGLSTALDLALKGKEVIVLRSGLAAQACPLHTLLPARPKENGKALGLEPTVFGFICYVFILCTGSCRDL